MRSSITRRGFLASATAVTAGFLGLRRFCQSNDTLQSFAQSSAPIPGFGPLVSDPAGLLDLPQGFSYQVVSRRGDRMDDGLNVPACPDGMAAFAGPPGSAILVRNHECEMEPNEFGAFGPQLELLSKIDRTRVYDLGRSGRIALGGTTTIVYDLQKRCVLKQFLSLAGTHRNCAGGPTPWGSWVTCEESELLSGELCAQDHGFAFEVMATTDGGLQSPVPLTAMGRFRREAIAVDPRSGAVYQTEDLDDGLFYRFLPKTPGRLAEGGRLQALAVVDRNSADLSNWPERSPHWESGTSQSVRWIDLEDVTSPLGDLRHRGFEQGAARFARGEGIWYGRDAIYFASTTGGPKKLGQIWRYRPSAFEGTADELRVPPKLELFIQSDSVDMIENADNLTVAPWGDLIVCEDGDKIEHLVGVTPEGTTYRLARNSKDDSEFAGATFSPDGSTLFANLQQLGITLAIHGPFPA